MMDVKKMAEDVENDNANAPKQLLETLGQQALALENMIADGEEVTKDMKAKLLNLMRKDIPDALDAAGASIFGFQHNDGEAVLRVGVKVTGTLSKAEDQEAAIKYLDNAGFGGGVKTVLTIEFTEAQRKVAEDLMGELEGRGHSVSIERKLAPATLASFVRQKYVEDDTFNVDLLGCTAWREAKFTRRA